MQPLIIAFQLLTRIPLPIRVDHAPHNHGYSILFYPLVGAVIGGAMVLLGQLLAGQPLVLQASLLLLLWVGVTGGLHLDGLADSADAWVGGMGSRERMLEIMKDPASGPMGVTAIVLVLLLKWSALVALIEADALLLLVWAPLLARTQLIALFQTTPYLREGGMGAGIAENIPQRPGWGVQLLVWGGALYFGIDVVILLLYLLVAWGLRQRVVNRLGGITGDVAGAMVEKMEVLLLLLIVLVE